MQIVFDPAKDEVNRRKHRISLARAADIQIEALVEDNRFDYGETRYRAYGLIDGEAHCLVFMVRGGQIRAISLRRAHSKEMRHHVQKTE
jgi:uncharacterized DUF497 family protein